MVVITCSFPGCCWETADRGEAFATVLAAELNNHTAGAHVAAAAPAAAPAGAARPEHTRTSVPKPARPVMKEDANDQDWMCFKYEWGQYKSAAGLTDAGQIRNELQFCCESSLKSRLLQTEGEEKLRAFSEEDLLEVIKGIAVLSVDPVVHRVKFATLKQEQGESLQKYVANLKSEASHCQFEVQHKYQCSLGCAGDSEKTLDGALHRIYGPRSNDRRVVQP